MSKQLQLIDHVISLIDNSLVSSNMSQSSANEPATSEQEKKVSDAVINEMVITKPDDFHLHLRDGASLPLLVPHTS